MFPYRVTFNSPGYLALLALIPLLWWLSYRNLSGLGPVRRIVALAVRSLVLVGLVLALAEAQFARVSDRLTVMYLVDESLSVSADAGRLARDYVNAAIHKRFAVDHRDSAGVIVFGREAAVELPPWDDEQKLGQIESTVDREYTNLADAMKLAQASFRHDTAKRIVIVSDGNENQGNAAEQAQAVADAGIAIDVVPVRSQGRGEVAVEKVTVPGDVRRGQPFDVRVVLANSSRATAEEGTVKGKLQILRRAGERQQELLQSPQDDVALTPGKHVFTVRETLDDPDFYTYEARFTPDDPADDTLPQNNRATTFTHIRGRGQVLLILNREPEDEDESEEEAAHKFDRLVAGLRERNVEVTVRSTRPEELFRDLAELQPYDTVVLADVPREQLSDAQIDMLARNTQNMGSGLVMLGGANSFGPGGWAHTPLEEAMPVDFHVKNLKIVPTGALMLVLDVSGSMSGDKLEMSKAAAIAAVKVLSPKDYVGVVAFDTRAQWIVPIRTAQAPAQIARRINRMAPGGGTDMYPAMSQAYEELDRVKAAIKHMIILTDGQTSGSGYEALTARMRQKGITTTAVAVGMDSAVPLLERIATNGGGKFYSVNQAKFVPRIFVKEATRVSRPLVYEKKSGFQPHIHLDHEMVRGLEETLPPITGYILTTAKDNPLVEISLDAPEPVGGGGNTVLASWTYGMGKTVAFTTDTGKRWANQWTQWAGYDKLFSQIVNWSMRDVDDSAKFTVNTDVEDGMVKVVALALDQNDEFINYLNVSATVVGPDMQAIPLVVKQTAPGRYVGEFAAPARGSYFVMLSPGPGKAPVRVGVNVSYSDEFRDHDTNDALLKMLARVAPKRALPGRVIEAPSADNRDERLAKMLEVDTFRHDLPPATRSQDIWHLLALWASCLFLGDVFVRRVNVNFAWAPPLAVKIRDRILRRASEPAPSVVIARLRTRKAEISDQLEQRRASTRFEPAPEATADTSALASALEVSTAETPVTPTAKELTPENKPAEESYTARLLKAKQKVWDDRNKES